MKTQFTPPSEQAMQCAMQIIHGGLFPTDIKLPTAEEIARIIDTELDLPWLLSIRRQAESMPTADSSLIAAIEGNYSGMSHSDLVLTCQMLLKGREAWKKDAAELLEALQAIVDALTQPVQTSHSVGRQWFDGLSKRDFENAAVLDDIRSAIAKVGILRGDALAAANIARAAIAKATGGEV